MSDADVAQVRAAQRDDGVSTDQLIDAYAAGPALLRASLDGLTAEQLHAHPEPSRMSVQEVVCHVADCEQFLADRMKRTAALERPLLVGVDGSRYLEALGYQQRDLALDLSLVDATRAQMSADLRRLPDDAWAREAIHTETGLVTLRQLLTHAVRHLEHHVTTIHAKRAVLLPGE